jgi:hypothetical protein
MDKRDVVKWRFTLVFLIVIPALVHALYQGVYKLDNGGIFWIGPISTTIPFFFLAILFLAHCFNLKSQSRRSAYCGAIMAWVAMMAFTIFIISHPTGHMTSTMGIAMSLGPFFYIPFLVVPYIIGKIIGEIWTK